ncbi:ABC transporter permease [Neobacillus sp. M.A.Huq-85]|uniref:ABC transporter permease n=1 Tax=Bacillus salipaludis TaxID=2547811 RepID=UPI00279F72E3|nr:ABC transporter permease [Bacillus salipaludis]WHY93770.1 ABC transporter permease [Neobacillus cucumis]
MAKTSLRTSLIIGLLLAPTMVVLMVFFLIPMLMMFFHSFEDKDLHFTLQNYFVFFKDLYYWDILWRSVKISVWTVLVTFVFGYPVAMYMAKSEGKVRSLVTLLVLVPHLVSVVIRNFGWTIILNENGLINSLLMNMGIIQKPLRLMYNELGTVIGLADSFIVYMILAIATSLYAIDQSLYKAASIMGARRFTSFFTITFPLSLPGIFSGIVLVFSLSMSAFVTPALLGGTAVKVMPTLIYQEILITQNWPFGTALSFILLAFTLILAGTFTKLVETHRYKEVFQS